MERDSEVVKWNGLDKQYGSRAVASRKKCTTRLGRVVLTYSTPSMIGFRPSHTSSPAKSLLPTAPSSLTTSDASRASAVSKSELHALSPTEVDFLDAVIRRIAPNATSFLSGLKAYNDELHERGLDSQTETVHYGRLLEICKLRGPSWQVKWDGVKKQYGYGIVPPRTAPRPKTPPQPRQTSFPRLARSPAYLMPPVRDDDDDVFTLHSHQDRDESEKTQDTEQTEEDQEECSSDTECDDEPARYSMTRPRQPQSAPHARPSNPPVSRVANPILPPSLTQPATPRPQHTYQRPIRCVSTWENTSDITDGVMLSPSNTPPSYRAAVRTGPTSKSAVVEHRNHLVPRAPSPIKLPKSEPHAQPTLPQPRERKGSVINEEDAWKKIKMARDEEDADKFRDDKLLERCWEIWLLGYQWLTVRTFRYSIDSNQVMPQVFPRRQINRSLRLETMSSLGQPFDDGVMPRSHLGRNRNMLLPLPTPVVCVRH